MAVAPKVVKKFAGGPQTQIETSQRVQVGAVRMAGRLLVEKDQLLETAPESRVKKPTGARQIKPL